MVTQNCKHCQNRYFYHVRRGKLRCKRCGYEFKPRIANFNLTKQEWKKLIFWFVLDQPIREIEKQTRLSHYSVSKATKLLRLLTTKDVPGIFSGTVEVDETCLGGQKKNKKKKQLIKEKLDLPRNNLFKRHSGLPRISKIKIWDSGCAKTSF